MLIVTKGSGSLVYYKKTSNGISKFKISKTKTINLVSGDVVYIPPKILHTHGSVKKNAIFSHIAVNLYSKKNEKINGGTRKVRKRKHPMGRARGLRWGNPGKGPRGRKRKTR